MRMMIPHGRMSTVDWKMIAIKNNCNFDWTSQIVNYLRCKINANFSNSLTERENIAKAFFAIIANHN